MKADDERRPGNRPARTPRVSTRAFTVGALAFALTVACGLSLFASSHPDGLESVAAAAGFLDSARDSSAAGGLLSGYGVAFIDDPSLSVAIAGAIGCLVTFALASLGQLAARRRRRKG
ncbi:PDGLE domain-containing protein [Microbacterium ulmi]|uniref:Cobalt ABC transporter permease n=1 Tax=Microbacterium ulmi TaxID=179095 RepID=A0A7Y2M233_9MICO|nr:PDGLE domain-containing protein [Microbacterium ulmi]NII69544.1 hypothetical protein [Microbacterium ulmi]NNH05085.1 cobalt ABC transporter permease [Microbacterium ulmi]